MPIKMRKANYYFIIIFYILNVGSPDLSNQRSYIRAHHVNQSQIKLKSKNHYIVDWNNHTSLI